MKKLYVGNLPWSISEDDLRAVFAEHGEVDSAKIMVDRNTNRSRGFGFVEFTNDDEGDKAIEAMNGKALPDTDRELVVNEARPMEDRVVGNEIYVGNLAYETTEGDLENVFGEMGEIASVKIISDRETNRSKGFAFINFVDVAAAEKAIEEWNGKPFPNTDRELVVNASRGKKSF